MAVPKFWFPTLRCTAFARSKKPPGGRHSILARILTTAADLAETRMSRFRLCLPVDERRDGSCQISSFRKNPDALIARAGPTHTSFSGDRFRGLPCPWIDKVLDFVEEMVCRQSQRADVSQTFFSVVEVNPSPRAHTLSDCVADLRIPGAETLRTVVGVGPCRGVIEKTGEAKPILCASVTKRA